MTKKLGRPKSTVCTYCPSTNLKHDRALCHKHARIDMMRQMAVRRANANPSMEYLDSIWPDDLICVCCKNKMTVDPGSNRRRVITLHIAKTGAMVMICHSCNCGNGNFKGPGSYGDELIRNRNGEKSCCLCLKVLPFSNFNFSINTTTGYGAYCRQCCRRRDKGRRRDKKKALTPPPVCVINAHEESKQTLGTNESAL